MFRSLEFWFSSPSVVGGFGGGERIRTVDFYIANVALYQLSYTPESKQRLAAPTVDRPALPGPLPRLCAPYGPVVVVETGSVDDVVVVGAARVVVVVGTTAVDVVVLDRGTVEVVVVVAGCGCGIAGCAGAGGTNVHTADAHASGVAAWMTSTPGRFEYDQTGSGTPVCRQASAGSVVANPSSSPTWVDTPPDAGGTTGVRGIADVPA